MYEAVELQLVYMLFCEHGPSRLVRVVSPAGEVDHLWPAGSNLEMLTFLGVGLQLQENVR